jgi:predicted ATPase
MVAQFSMSRRGVAHTSNGDNNLFQSYEHFFNFVTERCQFLGENFTPPLYLPSKEFGDIYKMELNAHNMMLILDFMQEKHPKIYSTLSDDLSWLVEHVSSLEAVGDEEEIKLSIYETAHRYLEAPTVSSGTARLLAMLTAYYALDMRKAEMPGLVVIEEPDTALNPGILGRFVEQLRLYTEREGYPRQFILTTHNPAFLDFFEPEEVRVVERDENGYTSVNKIPDYIREIWLDKYALGEVWTTNSFGGLPK